MISTQSQDLVLRDLQHIWHPCSQMKDYEGFPPIEIIGAEGSYLIKKNGEKLIDAFSSWWCKSLGHGHPRLKNSLIEQAESFEHIILANTTNEKIVKLSERLTGLTHTLNRVFYGGDGSTAVEIALKMSLQAQQIQGNPNKTQFAALENGYHGESAGALGVSALGLYRDQYEALLPKVQFLKGIPYIYGSESPQWDDCGDHWSEIELQLENTKQNLAGIILEPILQGAGGMLLYSPDLLRRLKKWTQENNVHLIFDEILTGFGRTGKTFAFEYAGVEPDILCLSKGLTGGWLPFSATLTTDNIYQLFYDDYASGKSFLHSNTFTGNALGVAVALEALNIYEDEKINQRVISNQEFLKTAFEEVTIETGSLVNVRGLGAMVAGELMVADKNKNERLGFQIFKEAVKLGALLRPLGNTIYWLLPLNVEKDTIDLLKKITIQAIRKVMG